MKNYLFSIILIVSSIKLISQPSDAQIKQDLVAKGALDVKFFSDKGTVHTTLTEKYYLRTAESKWKSNKPGIYSWSRSDYRYDFTGGKWTFTRSYFSDSWYEGIPNPSEAEVLKLIKSDIDKYFMGAGEVISYETIKIADKPKWTWESLKTARCNTEVIYTLKVDEVGNAKKIKEIRTVGMSKDSEDKNAPFVRMVGTRDNSIEPVLIENVKYKVEEEKSPFVSNQQDEKEEEKPEEIVYTKFSVNDKVTVNWNGQGKDFYNGKIVKTDPYDQNRYFIEFETIQSAWIHAKHMSKTSGGETSATSKISDNNSNEDFSEGDKVLSNWKNSGKYFPGKIAQIDAVNKNKVLIKYDDGDQEWTTMDKLKKK